MQNSNWKDYAELIGILAIIASLLIVVAELRQTQQALLASTYQDRAFEAIHEFYELAEGEYLAPILAQTDEAADVEAVNALNPVDKYRLRNHLFARMVDWDNEHYQYQQGFLDEDFFTTATLNGVMTYAPRWRAMGLTESREEFREFVDSVLAESAD